MKRYLNLNEISFPILKAICMIGLGIPAVFFLFSRLLGYFGLYWAPLDLCIWVFLKIGAILLLLFFLLVVLEQIQDHLLYRRYLQERGKQMQDECPFCGNRQIHPFEHVCRVCGEKIHLHEKG